MSHVEYFKGASGTGRTTFVNTLCEADVLAHKEIEPPESAHMEQRIKIKPATVGEYCELSHNRFLISGSLELEEDGIRIALTVVDTPGFGDNIDNEDGYVFSLA
jgi:cell division control protein 11